MPISIPSISDRRNGSMRWTTATRGPVSGDEGGAKGEGKKVTSLCVFLLCLFLKLCDVISGLYVVRWLCGVLDM